MSKILLAEDDEAMRHFLTKALIKQGHDVCDFANGEDALNHLKSNIGFDLLLTDIVMPGMDGIELSNHARDIAPSMKIMYITGLSGMNVGEHTKNSHNEPIKTLSKPFHLNDLIKQVDLILSED
jgi:two-component system cell cycle response regulator CpdR